MKKAIIEIKNLSKKFKNKVILNKINLEIHPGDIFGLLGPNGSGKTIFTQILLGLITPDVGKINIFGKELQKNLSWIHRRINFASSYSHLQEHLTIKDNLLTFARLYGIENPQTKITQLLKFFDLENHYQQKTKVLHLSSGENARLMLCKALINDPEILFLDEPTVSLDPLIKNKFHQLIKNIARQRSMTILYTSHDLIEVKKMCNRVAFLKRGKIIKILPIHKITRFTSFY